MTWIAVIAAFLIWIVAGIALILAATRSTEDGVFPKLYVFIFFPSLVVIALVMAFAFGRRS